MKFIHSRQQFVRDKSTRFRQATLRILITQRLKNKKKINTFMIDNKSVIRKINSLIINHKNKSIIRKINILIIILR